MTTVHYELQIPELPSGSTFEDYNCSFQHQAWTPVKNTDHRSQASTSSQEHYLETFDQSNLSNTKLKTTLCRNFIRDGYCPYNQRCQFAHGVEQLKCNSQQKHQYKTKICPNFSKKNFCPYGSRCNYRHQKAKTKKTKQWKQMHQNFGDLLREVKMETKMRDQKSSKLLKVLRDQNPVSVTETRDEQIYFSQQGGQKNLNSFMNYSPEFKTLQEDFCCNNLNSSLQQSFFLNYSGADLYEYQQKYTVYRDPVYFNSNKSF